MKFNVFFTLTNNQGVSSEVPNECNPVDASDLSAVLTELAEADIVKESNGLLEVTGVRVERTR